MSEEHLPTAEATEDFGRRLAAELAAGDLVVLDGPLGAGKTVLAKGIGAGLGVEGPVTSPTFIIAREHRAGRRPNGEPGVPMVHVDAYRLLDNVAAGGVHALDELDALDLDTELDDAVVVVEWGEGLVERLTDRYLLIRLRRAPEGDARTVRWEWLERVDGHPPRSVHVAGPAPRAGRG